jgi:hypothetical protein
MRKLKVSEALDLLCEANRLHRESPSYRYGQALYNILPKDITAEINCTEDDFFYWTDDEKVTMHFFSKFVEGVPFIVTEG